jgi:hypothetical protein
MKNVIRVVIFTFLACCYLEAESVTLTELERPGAVVVDRDGIYINDGPKVFIYSPMTFKLIGSFGERGEGPGEFKTHPNINRGGVGLGLHPDFLLISSQSRVSFFTKKGKLIRELNKSDFFNQYVPAGEEFVGFKLLIEEKVFENLEVILFDRDFNKRKRVGKLLLYDRRRKLNPTTLLRFPQLFYSESRIIFNDQHGNIHIYDLISGTESVVEPGGENGKRIRVSNERKNRYIHTFNHDPRFSQRGGYEALKRIVEFPEYFPASRAFAVDRDSIFVITFREKAGENEILQFDLNGKEIRKSYMKIDEINAIEFYPYAFYRGKLFQLIEDGDEASWKLRIRGIN